MMELIRLVDRRADHDILEQKEKFAPYGIRTPDRNVAAVPITLLRLSAQSIYKLKFYQLNIS